MVRIEPLKKNNFDTWKLQMKAILVKNKLWGYVDGTIKETVLNADRGNAQDASLWKTNDSNALSDIILSIHPSELKQVKNCATARELWLKLESIHQSSGPARKATLLKNLTLHKMSNDGDTREHVNSFFDTVDKLSEMDVEINPDLLAVMLLYSLPGKFENFRCAIESRDALPSPDSLRIKIIEESDARKKDIPSESSNAMIAKKSFDRREKNFNRREQSFDRREKNFDRREYKESEGGSSNFSNRQNPGGRGEFRCFKCNRKGHIAKKCRNFQQSASNASANTDVCLNTCEIGETQSENRDRKWCLDSGATSHMCNRVEDLCEVRNNDRGCLHLADSSSVEITGLGTARFVTNTFGEKRNVTLNDALLVPNLRTNLASVSKITDQGLEIHFRKSNAIIMDSEGNVRLCAKRIGDLYFLNDERESSNTAAIASSKHALDLETWHRRLGHVNVRDISIAKRDGKITGIDFDNPRYDLNCDVCSKAKMTRTPFPKRSQRQSNLLDLIHTDICGPMRIESLARSRYFIEFIDDKSRWCEVRFLRSKAEALKATIDYITLVENQKDTTVKCLQSDNGKEYVARDFTNYLKSRGIARRLTIPYNPEQNGVAERKNRTLQEMARCILMESGLPPSFWAEAVNTANYIRNRCPSKSLNGMTPYEVWTGEVPDLSHFGVFGSQVVYLDRQPGKGKFEARGKEGIFVGYADESKGYRIWSIKDKKVLISRDVKFTNVNKRNEGVPDVIFPDDVLEENGDGEERSHQEDYIDVPLNTVANEDDADREDDPEGSEPEAEENEICEAPRRGRGRPTLQRTGRKGRPRKIYNLASLGAIVEVADEQVMLSEVPMKQALSGPDVDSWHEAIDKEVTSIIKNNTWSLVHRTKHEKTIGSRIVLRNKMKPDGSLDKRKARLVAQGFSQRPGVHFSDTFAPVARLGTIRLMTSLAARSGMKIRQLDVTTAYLNGKLDERILMEPPKNLADILARIIEREGGSSIGRKAKDMQSESREGDMVCLLNKSLYGLKQAGRSWNLTLHQSLIQLGAVQSQSDPCVYYVGSGEDIAIVVIYVDDILIFSKNQNKMTRIEKHLSSCFEIKILGDVGYCLGIEFTRKDDCILMQQRGYIVDLLNRFGMGDANSVSTPIESGVKLTKKTPMTDADNKTPYRELVGALNYLATATRPDISFVASYLGQFNNCHGEEHWKAAKRVLRYLKGTLNVGLSFGKGVEPVQGFVDADWGGDVGDRHSFTGYIFLMNGSPISWDAKKQKTVALSTTEAEYIALAESAKECIFLRRFLREIGFDEATDISMFCDNNSAIKLAENPIFHARSKHIDIRHHFIRDLLKNKELTLRHISTNSQVADMLTKGLPKSKHVWCMKNSGLSDSFLKEY